MLRFMCRTPRTAYKHGQPRSAQWLSIIWNSLPPGVLFYSLRIFIAISLGSFAALCEASNAPPDAKYSSSNIWSVIHPCIICWMAGTIKPFTFNLWLLCRTYICLRPLSYRSLAQTRSLQPGFCGDLDICDQHHLRNLPPGIFRRYAKNSEPFRYCVPIASICASRRSHDQRMDGHGGLLRLRCGCWRAASR